MAAREPQPPTAVVLPLADPAASLERVGGKGASLARLARGGFPVPPGFHLTTAAYRAIVEANDLQQSSILATVASQPPDQAASAIARRFEQAAIPAALHDDLLAAYADLGTRPTTHELHRTLGGRVPRPILEKKLYPGRLRRGPRTGLSAWIKLLGPPDTAVAVRSSATAEDLPGLSFAGQQDTVLNVRGAEALEQAVRRCWASLWTARAIAYRQRHQCWLDAAVPAGRGGGY